MRYLCLILILITTLQVSLAQAPASQWSQNAEKDYSASHILNTSSDGFLISGNVFAGGNLFVGCVILTDNAGNEVARKIFDDISEILHSIELKDSYLIIGNDFRNSGVVYKLDKSDLEALQTARVVDIICSSPLVDCKSDFEPYFGKNALINNGDNVIVGGKYSFGIDQAFLVEFDANLDLVNELKRDPNIWGHSVDDLERATNGDLLVFGSIDEVVESDQCSCCDTFGGEITCDTDIWNIRYSSDNEIKYSLRVGSDACDEFIDATALPKDGFAIIGRGTALKDNCSSVGPTEISNFELDTDWIALYDSGGNYIESRPLSYVHDKDDAGLCISYSANSIHYSSTFEILITGENYLESFGFSYGIIQSLSVDFDEATSNQCGDLWDIFKGPSNILDDPGGEAYYYAALNGDCLVVCGNSSTDGKIWDAYGNCSGLICDNAIPIQCGQDTISNTFSSENTTNDYALCGAGSNYNGPDIVYEITDLGVNYPTDIFIGLRELGDGLQAPLDVFVIENCGLSDGAGNPIASCVNYAVRADTSEPALLRIPNANPESKYNIIIDSKSAEGDFRLSVSCPETFSNNDPLEINTPRLVNNATNGSSKISSYYIPKTKTYTDGFTGSEYKVEFTTHAAGDYTFNLNTEDGSDADLSLFLMEDPNPFTCIDAGINKSTAIKLTVFLDANQTYYLAIDAVKGVAANFELNIEFCLAEDSQILYNGNVPSAAIALCKEESTPQNINFTNTTIGTAPYTYFLTTILDTIITELPASFDISKFTPTAYRVHGLSYMGNLTFNAGQHISAAMGDSCEILSSNFAELNIANLPTANAGEGQSICETSTVQLNGMVANASSSRWTSSGIGSFNDPTLLNPIYTPSTSDIDNGNVTLTLTATSSGVTCPSETSDVIINIERQPTASLGEDVNICEGTTANVTGALNNEVSALWTSSGNGIFGDPALQNTTYTPGSMDLDQGGATLTLTAMGDNCPQQSDALTLNIVEYPTIVTNVLDTTICAGTSITLSSTGSNCIWYDANNNQIGNTCSISVSPQSSTSFRLEETNTLSLTACTSEQTINITVASAPEIQLINDTIVCAGESIQLVRENSSCPGCECLWTPSIGLDNPNSCDPIASPISDQLYTVQTSLNGACISEQSVELVIKQPLRIAIVNDHIPMRQTSDETLNLLRNDTFTPPLFNTNQLRFELLNMDGLADDITIQKQAPGELIISAGNQTIGLESFQYLLEDLECGNIDTGTVELKVFLNDQASVCNPLLEDVGCQILPNLNIKFPVNDIVIWDRAGNIVHLANPYKNDWKGLDIQTGQRVATGAYYFVLHLGGAQLEGQSQIIRGVISILWN